MRHKINRLGIAASAVLSLAIWTGGPVQAAPATSLFTVTALPDPSEALAFDSSTQNVFAMTEAETGDEGGGVDTDAVTTAVEPQCGEDVHDIAVMNADGVVQRYISISGEAEYMAVDPNLHQLYVPQYNDEGPAAPQCLAVVDINPLSASAWTVKYFPIPFTFVNPFTHQDTGYQYDPTGVAVDDTTGIVYIGGKMPDIEEGTEGGTEGTGEGGEDTEWGIGNIMAFDGNTNTFINKFVDAGDDPESLVFDKKAGKHGRVYTANEDEGTLTITSAVTGTTGAWNTTAFENDVITTNVVFDANECPAGVYQPAEADKLAVNENTNMVYMTDDRFRLAAIPGDVDAALSNVRILKLTENCPTEDNPEVYNFSNNIVIAPHRGATVPGGGRAGLAYVTSENSMITIVDLSTLSRWGTMQILDAQGVPAAHIDWPVINPDTNRFYISDEIRPAVFIYDLRDYVNPNMK